MSQQLQLLFLNDEKHYAVAQVCSRVIRSFSTMTIEDFLLEKLH